MRASAELGPHTERAGLAERINRAHDAKDTGVNGLECRDCGDQFQPSAYSPLCVVLVSLGIAEIHEDAVAHVVRDESTEAPHGLRDALLVGRNDLSQVNRILASKSRR